MRQRALTEKQRDVVQSLSTHKVWFDKPWCGWRWSTPSETKKLMEVLVTKGFARAFECPTRGRVYATLRPPEEHEWQQDICSQERLGFCTCGWPGLGPLKKDEHLHTKAEWAKHAKKGK